MDTPTARVQRIAIQSILPILFSILVGFIIYQARVFDRNYGAFQFLWTGIVSSVFYYMLTELKQRDAVLGFVLLSVLTFVTTDMTLSSMFSYVLRDIFYVAAIGVSVFVYYKYFRDVPADRAAAAPFMLAGLYAVAYMAAAEIHLAIIRAFGMVDTGGTVIGLASTTAYFGVLIGFAIGAGIALNRLIEERRGARGRVVHTEGNVR